MNWDALGAISELTAALAFLVSFLFVGHQLRQNREKSRWVAEFCELVTGGASVVHAVARDSINSKAPVATDLRIHTILRKIRVPDSLYAQQ